MQKSNKDNTFRRYSSISHFRTVPEEHIVFNPNQFHVGQSKIRRLPERVITRRNSQPTLPRTQKSISKKQDKQLQLSLMIKVNEKLSKQNKQLKKQIQLYKKIIKGRNSCQTSASKDLRSTVMQKINRTKCSSRLVSDCETGLYSSKQISYGQFQSIKQMHQNYMKKAIVPSFSLFHEQLKKFFTQIQETCIKIKFLFEGISNKQVLRRNAKQQLFQSEQLMTIINEFCHAKIQQQKLGKYPGINRPKSKLKVQRQPTRQKQEQIQLMSPQQVVDRFQKYILKVMRSPKTMKSLKSNIVVTKFKSKLSEI